MVDQRKEPTLSSLGSSDKSPLEKQPQRQRPAMPRPQMVVKRESSGLLWFTFFIVLLLVAVVGYGGWQFFLAQGVIKDQQLRIDDLEKQLTLSGDESTQSLTALAANLRTMSNDVKLALTEVDKLWGTRNVNRKAITDNKEALEASLGAAVSDLKKLQTLADQQRQALVALETQAKTQSGVVEKLNKEFSGQEILIQSLRERVASQGESIAQLESSTKKNASTASKINSIAATVKANEEAVKAFDAFRRTTNRDILLLKERTGSAQ